MPPFRPPFSVRARFEVADLALVPGGASQVAMDRWTAAKPSAPPLEVGTDIGHNDCVLLPETHA